MSHRLRIDTVPPPCVVALVVLICSGCTLGPDYARPTVDTPAAYRFANGTMRASTEGTRVDVTGWWRGFGDGARDSRPCAGSAVRREPAPQAALA